MFAAINAWTFPPHVTSGEQLVAAAAAGFRGFEAVIGEEEGLRFTTPAGEFTELGRRAGELGISIDSLATADFWRANYADAAASKRELARDMTLRMLDRAVDLGAGAILVVPAVVGLPDEPRGRVRYADALARSLDALADLRHEAAARDVIIAVENVPNRFLLSPVELADFVDRVNSGFVGVYLDVGDVLPIGYPEDWIATLSHRIRRVHVKDCELRTFGRGPRPPLGEGDVDWAGVAAALRRVGYGGPLTYEGEGEPMDIRRRIENILAGRPVREEA